MAGGSGQYAYLWYNVSFNIVGNQQNLVNVAPGTYYLQVDDLANKGCTSLFYYTVNSTFKVTYNTVANTVCTPPYTGSISAIVSGGTGDYSFTWQDPDGKKAAGTSIRSNARGGNYKLTVRDNTLGCEKEITVYLANTASATLAVTGTSTPSSHCAPGNGSIDITAANGTKNYTYMWYNQATGLFASATEDLNNATAGPYSVYVLDNLSGCTAYKLFAIADATTVSTYSLTATPNTNCLAPFNGAVDLSFAQPGSYDVLWSDGSRTEDLANAAPGSYQVTVKDKSTGCAAIPSIVDYQSIIVSDQSKKPLQLSLDKVAANTNCLVPNGAIQTTLTARDATLQWTGPNGFTANTEDLTALDSGTYILTATVSCNAAPIVKTETLSAKAGNTLTLNLLDLVSDDDDNLDVASLAICQKPVSGASASISAESVLTITYDKSFQGQDHLRIRACDLMRACSENDILIDVQAAAVLSKPPVEPSGPVTVYNAIAPNSPGNNKFMRIDYLPAGTDNRVSVFNRWGDKVFETENYTNNIPGKRFEGFSNNGQPLPSGTYFYKIEFADASNTLTGYLSLKQ
jgi:gliding motility-associated-like protein